MRERELHHRSAERIFSLRMASGNICIAVPTATTCKLSSISRAGNAEYKHRGQPFVKTSIVSRPSQFRRTTVHDVIRHTYEKKDLHSESELVTSRHVTSRVFLHRPPLLAAFQYVPTYYCVPRDEQTELVLTTAGEQGTVTERKKFLSSPQSVALSATVFGRFM